MTAVPHADRRAQTGRWARHFEARCDLPATAQAVFAGLDDQSRLAAYMAKPSPMMGDGSMTYEFDAGRGMVIGSPIKMGGPAFGLTLFVDGVVTERDPPRRKVWKTVGVPRLLIIGGYEMGFAPEPRASHCRRRACVRFHLGTQGSPDTDRLTAIDAPGRRYPQRFK